MWCPRSPPKGWAKPLAGKMHVNAYGAVGKLHAYRIMQGFVPKKQVYTKNLPSMTHNPYSRVYYFDLALGFLSFNDGIMMVWSGWGDSCVGHHDTKGDFGAWPMPPSRRGQIPPRRICPFAKHGGAAWCEAPNPDVQTVIAHSDFQDYITVP